MFIYDSGDWHKGGQFANLSPRATLANILHLILQKLASAEPKVSLPNHSPPTYHPTSSVLSADSGVDECGS